MKNLSKLSYFLLFFLFFALLIAHYLLNTTIAKAQVPGLKFPCDQTDENEFNTLRPYQASPCSDGPKALFCSNKLVIFENFQLKEECRSQKTGCPNCDWTCNLNYQVEPHNLNITLDESELPIMGNTQDDFDNATKLNEYASWYLSGIDSTGSTGETTDDRVVNFSGPINKLLPQMIQDAERKRTIARATNEREYTTDDDQGKSSQVTSVEMHNQIVACGDVFKLFGIWDIGQIKPTDCYNGNEKIRLKDWIDGDLSDFNKLINRLGGDVWNKRYPPLPWADENNKPFESQTAYQKAYREWRGASCITIPGIDKNLCLDNPFVPNKWAKLYPYIPLSSTTDVEGKNYLLTGDGPNYVPSQGTGIENAQHKSYKNAPLYLPHLQEVYDLSQILNKTFRPQEYESEPLPKTTEKLKKGISTKSEDLLGRNSDPKPNDQFASRDPYSTLDCSAVNVRVNEGDDIFPGDRPSEQELYVEGVEYTITQVECHEENRIECLPIGPDPIPCTRRTINILNCPAQVGIEFKLGTKTPLADEIFSQTVADSGSTFRKIFPKVEEGAPVECIADIPTTTNVTYSIDNPLHQVPAGGEQEFKQTSYPADGANSGTQLTFPHIGSVYEYFLKGIQTALRPKGFGEPIANGNCKPTEEEEESTCKEDVPDSAVNNKYLGQFKTNFIDLANRWSQKCPGGENNMAEKCYNFVASEAQKAGVNPAFVLTIWLNESGASNYCEGGTTTQDFGMNLPSIYQNISEQLKKFLDFAKVKWCDGQSGFVEPMHGWLSRFQSSAGVCNPNDPVATQYYHDVMNTTWSWVTGCTTGGKFGIQWPTDGNCP